MPIKSLSIRIEQEMPDKLHVEIPIGGNPANNRH